MKIHDNRAWMLVLPAASVLAVFGLLPLIAVFNYSFHDIFTLKDAFYIGADWYRDIIRSERFHDSLMRSALFSALTLAIQLPLGLGIALLLRRSGRIRVGFLMLLALPLVVPWNMIPVMWLNLIHEEHGLAGRLIAGLGVDFDWKFNALHTWILILVMDCWHWVGLVAILAFAGLSAIPPAFYQAAAIDGASRLAVFRHVELPKLGGVLSIAILLRFVDSFMIYTEAFTINAGGPDGATTFLSLDLGEAIKGFNYGPAAALSILYFLIVVTVAWIFRAVSDRSRREGLS